MSTRDRITTDAAHHHARGYWLVWKQNPLPAVDAFGCRSPSY